MSFPRDPMNPGVPIHPGEFLREDMFLPLGLSEEAFAADLGIPVEIVRQLLAERLGINAELAYRLALYFDMDVHFWTNWQTNYELGLVYLDRFESLKREVTPRSATKQLVNAA